MLVVRAGIATPESKMSDAGAERFRFTVEEAIARLPGSEGGRSVRMFEHGTLSLLMYTPRGEDRQTPHGRDEVYVVVRGSGKYRVGDDATPFGPGDALFAPAGVGHRFEDFTDDLALWVMFYGPEGGERPRSSPDAAR